MEPGRIVIDEAEETGSSTADIGLFRLADEIRVSERGFGRRDAIQIPTHHAVLRWAQLIHAVGRLTDLLDEPTL
jgi:hypothetical protein